MQDYLFLIDYARVLAYASAKAPDLDAQTWFARLLAVTLDVEMEMNQRTCRDWGIAPSDLDQGRGADPGAFEPLSVALA